MDDSKFNSTDWAFFAAFAVVALIFITDGWRRRITQNKRFAVLAAAFGAAVTKVDKFEQCFETTVGERAFVVTEKLVSTGTGKSSSSSYKFISSTTLAGKAWESHFFTVRPRGSVELWLVKKLLSRSKKPLAQKLEGTLHEGSFSSDFTVVYDRGVLPPNWLNSSAKDAIRAFYVQPESVAKLDLEALNAESGRLETRLSTPYKKLNASNLKALLERQARVADAIEAAVRTALHFQ